MRGERTKVRLYVSAELDRGCTVGLTPTQAHYLKHVLRLEAGDSLSLFNGRDGEWTALIDGLGKGWGSLSVQERRRGQEAEPDLWLVFAPIKRTRIDFLAQKATELGVSALWPVFTRHTVVSRVNTERLRANAVEAAEQSGRLTVPTVFEPATLDEVLARWPAERRLALCDNSGGGVPIADALAQASEGPWALLVGPEGGIAGSELDALRKLPFVTVVGLGPRVLRADTAALAALACWQALVGDWRRPRAC